MNEVRNELAEQFDYIIYDMPAINAAMDAKVIAVNADATMLVTSVGSTSKKGLIDAANTLTEVNANLIGTIINKLDMDQYISYHEDYDYFENEKYARKKTKKKKDMR